MACVSSRTLNGMFKTGKEPLLFCLHDMVLFSIFTFSYFNWNSRERQHDDPLISLDRIMFKNTRHKGTKLSL
jgi:hypothetical protein